MINKYFDEVIFKNKDKLLCCTDITKLIEISIENLNLYEKYLCQLKKNKDLIDLSLEKKTALDMYLCYSSYFFESFCQNLVINNFQSIMMLQRCLLELYFKISLLIHSDDYVSRVFLDFKHIALYNLLKIDNTIDRLSESDSEEIYDNRLNVLNKYNLSIDCNYSDDYWIKLSLKHLGVISPSKNLSKLIDYLVENGFLSEILKSDYKSCCDYIHSGISAIYITQDMNDENNIYKYLKAPIQDFNYIILNIVTKMQEIINLSSNDIVEKLKNKVNYILDEF